MPYPIAIADVAAGYLEAGDNSTIASPSVRCAACSSITPAIIDWTTLTNGPHTIGWLITDRL
jgi:hypothetical protein